VTTVAALLAAVEPTRPVLTWYDDGTGERTELSGATLGNWVAKTANLLVDGVGAQPGDRAVILLPPHWQTAAVLLGAWSAGLVVATEPGPGEVGFATPSHAGDLSQSDRYLVGLHPLGLPLPSVPDGYLDYAVEVRSYGDVFRPSAPSTVEPGALELPAGERVLIDVDTYPDPRDWLLAPLAAGASTVLCRRLDRSLLAKRAEAERVSRILVD
jgi:uncharacterized protein (TIGR03089 family)